MSEEIRVRLINEDYLRERWPVPSGVDTQNILRTIRIAQSVYLIDVLGSCLYDALEQHIIDGTISDQGNEDFLSLLILSKDFLVYRTVSILNDAVIAGDSIVGNEPSERNGMAQSTDSMYSEYESRIRALVLSKSALWDIANPSVCAGYNQFDLEETGVVTYYPPNYEPNNCGK